MIAIESFQEFLVDEFSPAVHLCAVGVIGQNTCTGDSGAGLVVEVDGVHQVVGVVSGGTGGTVGWACRDIMPVFIAI